MKTVQEQEGNLTWTLDNGTLTIGGTGAMPNYSSNVTSPWYKHGDNITTVNIQDGVTTIGDRAFDGCSSLTSITIPNSVTSIGSEAFYDCESLTDITIPSSVTTIVNRAFYKCLSLDSITVSSGNTAYASEDGVLFNKSKTIIHCYPRMKGGHYTIPDSVTTIGDMAFSSCPDLYSVTIPNSVTTIGYAAFTACTMLHSITIGNSVTTIGDLAFAFCWSLRGVEVLRTSPPSIVSGVFQNVPLSSATLIVPYGSRSAYRGAAGWNEFGTIVEATR